MGITQPAILPEEALAVEASPSYRILVVDDNKDCAKVLMWTLELLGHTAQVAYNGQSAIALAKSFHPDVVFLDIGLPGMNGYEVCKAMRNEPILQNTFFVAQTGWGQNEHRERSKEAGFDHHLVKPIDIEVLKNILLVLDKKEAGIGL